MTRAETETARTSTEPAPVDVQGAPREAAQELVAILADEGVRHLFFNPGTDTAPIQEALADAREHGLPHPESVLCTHEQVALSAALGHHLISGRPQALMVHVDAGTLNLGGAIHNIQRNHIPVVAMAGRSPYSLRPDVPGHRDSAIHWQQEQPDQPAVMRAYGKWNMEVPRGRELGSLVRRAFQVAGAAPAGLTYLMLPRETLMEPGGDPTRHQTLPKTPAPDPEGLEELAKHLAAAERPVIIADRVGRRPESVDVLVEIAELLGAPVLEGRDSVNFPSDHALYGGPKASTLLRRADVVLLLASEVPWVPAIAAPPPDATILQIDVDCVKASMPSWSYPIRLSLTADPATALPALLAVLERLGDGERRQVWSRQRAEAEAEVAALHEDWRRRASSTEPADTVDAMLAALDRALPRNAITVEEAVTNSPAVMRQLHRPAGRHFGVGAPALGSGLGAAIGAKLADPDAAVFAITGDGAFNFGVPTSALWAAHRAGAPFVTVILDNGTYLASRMPVERLFPEGSARRRNDFPETRLGSPIDYAALARSCGGDGIVVESPDQMGDAVQKAVAALAEGRCTVIDAMLPSPP